MLQSIVRNSFRSRCQSSVLLLLVSRYEQAGMCVCVIQFLTGCAQKAFELTSAPHVSEMLAGALHLIYIRISLFFYYSFSFFFSFFCFFGHFQVLGRHLPAAQVLSLRREPHRTSPLHQVLPHRRAQSLWIVKLSRRLRSCRCWTVQSPVALGSICCECCISGTLFNHAHMHIWNLFRDHKPRISNAAPHVWEIILFTVEFGLVSV